MKSIPTPIKFLLVLALSGCSRDEPPMATDKPPDTSEPAVMAVAAKPNSAAGRATYGHYCADCHDAGEGHPGTMRLGVRAGAENAILLARSDLTPEYVKLVVRNGLQMMPPFRPTEIADADLDALADFVAGGATE